MHRARYARKQERHTCGFTYDEHDDPERTFYLHRTICRAEMHIAAYDWLYDERYGGKFHDGSFRRWSDTRSTKFPYGHRDGVELRLTATDVDPDATWHLPPERLPIQAADGARFVTPEPSEGGDS